jgi:hypothetical protein
MPTVFNTPYIPNPRKPKPAEAVVETPDQVRARLWADYQTLIADAKQERQEQRRKARKPGQHAQLQQQRIGTRFLKRNPRRRSQAKALQALEQTVKQLRPARRPAPQRRQMRGH